MWWWPPSIHQTDQDLRSIISIIFAMQSNKVMMVQHAIMPMAKEATVLTQSYKDNASLYNQAKK